MNYDRFIYQKQSTPLSYVHQFSYHLGSTPCMKMWETKHCLMISCREKKLVWILVRMNSKYLYMEVVKLGVPPNHPSHGRPWPWLSIETTMVTWKFPLSENLHIISMNHSKQQHMARCQHIPFVPERTDLQRNQFSPSGHKYALHVCYICMYIIYIHIMYISIINSCRLHSCIIFLHAHKKKVKALYQ